MDYYLPLPLVARGDYDAIRKTQTMGHPCMYVSRARSYCTIFIMHGMSNILWQIGRPTAIRWATFST